jgi:hypothetical protein
LDLAHDQFIFDPKCGEASSFGADITVAIRNDVNDYSSYVVDLVFLIFVLFFSYIRFICRLVYMPFWTYVFLS